MTDSVCRDCRGSGRDKFGPDMKCPTCMGSGLPPAPLPDVAGDVEWALHRMERVSNVQVTSPEWAQDADAGAILASALRDLRQKMEGPAETRDNKVIFHAIAILTDNLDAIAEMNPELLEDTKDAIELFKVIAASEFSARKALAERTEELTRARSALPIIQKQGIQFGAGVWISFDKLCGWEGTDEEARKEWYSKSIIAKQFMKWAESVAALSTSDGGNG